MIEFNKEAKRVILSHSRIFEDEQKGAKKETGEKKSSAKRGGKKEEESAMVTGPVEKTTLGDIEELAAPERKSGWQISTVVSNKTRRSVRPTIPFFIA